MMEPVGALLVVLVIMTIGIIMSANDMFDPWE